MGDGGRWGGERIQSNLLRSFGKQGVMPKPSQTFSYPEAPASRDVPYSEFFELISSAPHGKTATLPAA